MKHNSIAVLVLGVLASIATGCVRHAPQPSASTLAQERPSEVIEFPRQTLIFKPTRPDFRVGRVILNFYCSNPEAVRVNGLKPDPTWRDVHFTSNGIVVDRRSDVVSEKGAAWMAIFLTQVSSNQFELPDLKIESSGGERSGYLCIAVKAWFNEVGNVGDGLFYQHLDDRYALVSHSTFPGALPPEVRHRFTQNRVATLTEFRETLSRPFVIQLNQRPLAGKRTP